MNDALRHLPAQEPASTEGMESLFTEPAPEGQDNPGHGGGPGQDSPALETAQPEDTPVQDWTVSEAARVLKVSEKTVLRRLQRGALPGYKITGQFGQEWRVRCSGQDSPTQPNSPTQDTSGQTVAIELHQDHGKDREVIRLRCQLEMFERENMSLREQLQGATYRNGYLQSKLEERESQIKLLTDSQHSVSWWRRSWDWFIGKK